MPARAMKRRTMAGIRLAGALIAVLASAALASAETYPSHPVTMMVGFPPGGPTDTLARILADGMQAPLGQPVVVETLSGASGTLATGRVAHARPDGYTIGIGQWSSLAASPLWIIGRETLPPANMAELIEWIKARPAGTTFGTVGMGSAGHLCGIYFSQKAGLHLQFVPYRGGGPAMQDLIGGQIDLACLEASAGLAYVQAGKFKAYAVMSDQRWPKSPDTPTLVECGIPGATINFWHGLWTTKGAPKEAVDRLDAAVMSAFANPAVQQRLEALGQVIFPRDQ